MKKGEIMSLETRQKLSSSLKGRKVWNKGISPSPETREKIRNANLGKKYPESTRDKHRQLFLGEKNPKWKGGITSYEYKLYLNSQRRKLKFLAHGEHSFEEWESLKEYYGFSCLKCKRKEPEIKLSRDHIIPLSLGGSDSIENIQPLCRVCNSGKRDKIEDYRSQTTDY